MRAWERNARNGVPTSGRDAFRQAWTMSACPHDPASVAAMLWHSDWWRASAEALASHVGESVPDSSLEALEPGQSVTLGCSWDGTHYVVRTSSTPGVLLGGVTRTIARGQTLAEALTAPQEPDR